MSCTTRRSTPAAKASVAAPCRRSCSRIGGNPATAVNCRNVRVSRSGANGSPRTPVNTNPLSLYEPAASSRSSACRRRCRRSAATVVRSSAIVLTLRAVFGGPHDQVTAVLLQLLTDRRHPGIQVHVAPPQPGRLTTPQPPQRDQVIRRAEPVRTDRVQELRRLTRRPHRRALPRPLPLLDPGRGPHHRLRSPCRRHLHPTRRIHPDQPLPQRSIQRRPQRRPDPRQTRPRLIISGRHHDTIRLTDSASAGCPTCAERHCAAARRIGCAV